MSVCGTCRQRVKWLHLPTSTVMVDPVAVDSYKALGTGSYLVGRPVGPTHRRHRCPESSTAEGDAA